MSQKMVNGNLLFLTLEMKRAETGNRQAKG
jgi:hypothetical protein